LHKDALPKVLGVSGSTVRRFLQAVAPGYLTADDDGCLYLSDSIFRRGRLSRKQYEPYMKLYFDGIRSLYRSSSILQRKRLGEVFALMPYINREYNMFCRLEDAEETCFDRIEPLSLLELCKCGYDYKHLGQFTSNLTSMEFILGKEVERVFSINSPGIEAVDQAIFINPHILYQGSDYQTVIRAGGFDSHR
jgi:hypothetical protein